LVKIEVMAKSIDEAIIKEAVEHFIHSNPELVKSWIEEVLSQKKEDAAPLFPKFDKEKIIREHAISRASMRKAQQFFKEAPPAEEMIKLLTK
jgi:hypothetical protein